MAITLPNLRSLRPSPQTSVNILYVIARKGREAELPVETGLLTHLDLILTVPVIAANGNVSTAGRTAR